MLSETALKDDKAICFNEITQSGPFFYRTKPDNGLQWIYYDYFFAGAVVLNKIYYFDVHTEQSC